MSDSDSMNEDHIIGVCPEQVSMQTTPVRQSSSSSNDVVISMDEISVTMEDTANATYLEAAALSSGETRHCRFCHAEDLVRPLEAPCGCTGTLRYAHRSCTTWCNTKGDIMCEICDQPCGPDYAVTEGTSSLQTRVVMDSASSSPSTPTTITQAQSPLQPPGHRVPDLSRWANLMVPCRGLLYATLLVLFLVVLIVNDVFTVTKTTKKDLRKAFYIIFVVVMMVLVPFALMSCIYECNAQIREHLEERNRRAQEGGVGASSI